MDIRIWDEEFLQTCSVFKSIEEEYKTFNQSFFRTIARKNRVIDRCLAAVDRLQVRFERFNQTKDGLPKRLTAIIFWTAEMSVHAGNLIRGYDTYLKQFMWIRLFKIRFLGDDSEGQGYLLRDSQLENIADRFHSQKKMEAFLHRQHYQLRLEEKKLRQTYNLLQAEEANFEAAHSLQHPWGRGIHNSQRHPMLGEVQRLFFGIGFSSDPQVAEATQLKILSREFYRKTQKLMDDCRNLMEQNDRTKTPYFDNKKVAKVRKTLKQIRNLEHKVDNLAHKVLPNMRRCSPILVKKKTIQVTTMPGRKN